MAIRIFCETHVNIELEIIRSHCDGNGDVSISVLPCGFCSKESYIEGSIDRPDQSELDRQKNGVFDVDDD